jgi:hypothetical protein
MPTGTARTIVKWFALVWVSSLVLAGVVLGATAWSVGATVRDTQNALAAHDYSAAVEGASSLSTKADACRIALMLPGPLTLRLVPGVSTYARALELGCGAMYEVGSALDADEIRVLAARLTEAPSLAELGLDRKLMQQGLDAFDAVSPHVTIILSQLQDLDSLGLPGGPGTQIHTLAASWPPQRFREVQTLASVTPWLLGFDRPRTYFVALESDAEMRATGGFLGQYAIMRITGGKAKVLHIGPNTELVTPKAPGVKLLSGTEVITQTDNPMWVNSNLSPHGPDVGALWMYAWEQQSGTHLDGAIGMDITTAARLAAASGGSITKPDGKVLRGAAAIADYAQNGVYFDFDGPDRSGDPRKAYQLTVLRDLLRHASSSILNVDSMLNVLPGAIAENRLLLTFANAKLQARIASSPVAHDLRSGTGAVLVTWNNWSGNKFDYYMRVDARATCTDGGADLRLVVRSTAQPGRTYTAYIGQRLDKPGEKRASVRDQFLIMLPVGADVRWLSVDGRIAPYQVTSMGDRPVAQLLLDTLAGQRHVVRVGIGGASVSSLQVQGAKAMSVTCG